MTAASEPIRLIDLPRLRHLCSRAGLWLFVLALLLRVGWVGFQWHRTGPALEFDDERLHLAMASNLVQTGQMVSDDGRFAARMPLYPLFLAIFAGAGETGILLARLAQAGLGAVTVYVVYRLARAALGPRAALLAGALACVDPYAIFFTNLLLSEVPFTLIAVVLTAVAWRLVGRETTVSAAALGGRPEGSVHQICYSFGFALLGAAAVLTRPSAFGWVLLLWVFSWLMDRSKRRANLRLLGCVGILGLLLLPWGLRNHDVIGAYAWLSTNGGVTLYDGQGPQADGSSNQEFLTRIPGLSGMQEAERDRFLHDQAVEQMRRDPLRVLRLAGTKFLRTWSFIPNVETYRAGPTAAASALFTAAVLILALVALWRTVLGRPPRPSGTYQALVWLPILYFTLLHCIYVGSLRYRVPLMPFLELSAAAAIFARPHSARE